MSSFRAETNQRLKALAVTKGMSQTELSAYLLSVHNLDDLQFVIEGLSKLLRTGFTATQLAQLRVLQAQLQLILSP